MAKNTASASSKSLVESMIDSMVKESLDPKTAVANLLEAATEAKDEKEADSDLVEFKEGEDIVCPDCGSTDFEEGFVESESGEELNALRCKSCGLGLVESEEPLKDETEVVEAEIDENNPVCPSCGSDDLDGEMVESEGKESLVIHCAGCGATMVAAD